MGDDKIGGREVVQIWGLKKKKHFRIFGKATEESCYFMFT